MMIIQIKDTVEREKRMAERNDGKNGRNRRHRVRDEGNRWYHKVGMKFC